MHLMWKAVVVMILVEIEGVIQIGVQFMADVYLTCETCREQKEEKQRLKKKFLISRIMISYIAECFRYDDKKDQACLFLKINRHLYKITASQQVRIGTIFVLVNLHTLSGVKHNV